MALKQKIQKDFKKALKEKKGVEISTLRMLNAAISNKETEKRTKIWKEKPESKVKELEKESQLTNEEIIQVISSEIKKRKESVSLFEKGKRNDLVEKEKEEIKILMKYLPEQLSEEEIGKLAKKTIAVLRASLTPSEREKFGAKDIGRVMGVLMPKLKGKAEGSVVSKIVRELLES